MKINWTKRSRTSRSQADRTPTPLCHLGYRRWKDLEDSDVEGRTSTRTTKSSAGVSVDIEVDHDESPGVRGDPVSTPRRNLSRKSSGGRRYPARRCGPPERLEVQFVGTRPKLTWRSVYPLP